METQTGRFVQTNVLVNLRFLSKILGYRPICESTTLVPKKLGLGLGLRRFSPKKLGLQLQSEYVSVQEREPGVVSHCWSGAVRCWVSILCPLESEWAARFTSFPKPSFPQQAPCPSTRLPPHRLRPAASTVWARCSATWRIACASSIRFRKGSPTMPSATWSCCLCCSRARSHWSKWGSSVWRCRTTQLSTGCGQCSEKYTVNEK